MIISHGRIAAAGCEFPLSEADAGDRIIGSRHRAALGMSLETDALVLVVSEETGAISVAERGHLHGPLKPESLRKMLANELLDEKKRNERKRNEQTPKPSLAGSSNPVGEAGPTSQIDRVTSKNEESS